MFQICSKWPIQFNFHLNEHLEGDMNQNQSLERFILVHFDAHQGWPHRPSMTGSDSLTGSRNGSNNHSGQIQKIFCLVHFHPFWSILVYLMGNPTTPLHRILIKSRAFKRNQSTVGQVSSAYTHSFYKIAILDFLQKLRTNWEQAQAGFHLTLSRSLFCYIFQKNIQNQ